MTQAQGSTSRLLAGRYRLDSVLGRGGMGTVWRAEDEMLGRVVAVKELRLGGGVDEEEKRRLVTRTLREAKATARIRNTGAVTVFDVVEEDDRPWIVMELVESRSLSDVIKQDGPLKPERAAEIGLELLGVLRSAHSHGILHRDVKPSNVLIGDDGRVVLTDFGIASVEGDPSVTSTGMLVGAPSYISPERARGQKPGPPADLWSLGATLYAMVEGKAPYDKGSALSTLTAVMMDDLQTPQNAGPLRPVIEGLLRKDPEERLDELHTRSMLRRVVTEAARQAEAEARQAAAPEATAVMPAVADRKSADKPRSAPGGAVHDAVAGAPVGTADRKGTEPGVAAVAGQDAGSDAPGGSDDAQGAGASGPAKRGSGVLSGLLGTVRVGSRTPAAADGAVAAAGSAVGQQAEAAAPPQTSAGGGAAPAALRSAKSPAADRADAAPVVRPEAPKSKPVRTAAALSAAGMSESAPALPAKAPAKPTTKPTAKPATKPTAKPATKPTAKPATKAAGEQAPLPPTALLPAVAPGGDNGPAGTGGTVYGGSLAHRVQAWRAQPADVRRPNSRVLLAGVVALTVLVVAVVLGVHAASSSGSGPDDRADGHPGSLPSRASHTASKPSPQSSGAVAVPPAAPQDPATTAPPVSAPPGSTSTGDDGDGGKGSTDGKGSGVVPAGYITYPSPGQDLSIVVPKGMAYVGQHDSGDELLYQGDDPLYKDWEVIVQRRTDATSDPLADLQTRSHFTTGYPDYQLVSSAHKVSYRGWKAADWSWEYDKPPVVKHALARTFLTSEDHGYLIQWVMPEDQWNTPAAQRARDLSYNSFEPGH